MPDFFQGTKIATPKSHTSYTICGVKHMPAFLKTSLSPEPQKTALALPLFFSEYACKTFTGRHLCTQGRSSGSIQCCSLPDQSRSKQNAVKLMTAKIANAQKLKQMINKLTAKSHGDFLHSCPQQANSGLAKP
jgi:hypothetical protein